MSQREILFEGFTQQEILDLPAETIEGLIVFGEPLVFKAGSATILGSFKTNSDHLVIELAQIDGGGEGILLSLGSLARRYAALRKLKGIEWIVHAVTCAKPNLKLRSVLLRRGFLIEELPAIGTAYHLIETL